MGSRMNTEYDELLYYLRQAASLINGFPKMDARECIPPQKLVEAADEIERLRNQLAEALDATHSMVVQYCKDHKYGGLDSLFLGASANAMRLLDEFNLLKNFDDRGGRCTMADMPDSDEYKRVEERLQQIRQGQK
jgi:hypothetical protein